MPYTLWVPKNKLRLCLFAFGRAEVRVASTMTKSSVNATLLSNAWSSVHATSSPNAPLYPSYTLAIGLHIPMFWLLNKFFCKKISFFIQKFARLKKKHYLCTRFWEMTKRVNKNNLVLGLCGNSSVGRARPCQGRGREFESRLPL